MSDQRLHGSTLYFDCFAGIAGDMAVAALVDLGVPKEVVREALAALAVDGYSIAFERVKRGALTGLKFRVMVDGGQPHVEHEHHHGHEHSHDHSPDHDHSHDHDSTVGHPHRHYSEIRAVLVGAPLREGTLRRALAMFDRIAAVEAKLHGVPVAEVAFHEVGAIDSIVDIVATAAALDWLSPARVVSRRVPLGRGSVHTAHGRLPIPAPATLELLLGAEVEEGGAAFELTTPTGAAILAASVDEYGSLPSLAVTAVGWGAGDRELADRPNLLRVVAGREQTFAGRGAQERAVMIEANIDDLSPELVAPILDALLAAGARDAWLQPVLMKKGRPAFLVAALTDAAARQAVEAALFRESSTIGVRAYEVDRTVLERRIVEVATPFGIVPVKVAGAEGEELNAAPEFEACRVIARERGVPLKRVFAEALAAFYRR